MSSPTDFPTRFPTNSPTSEVFYSESLIQESAVNATVVWIVLYGSYLMALAVLFSCASSHLKAWRTCRIIDAQSNQSIGAQGSSLNEPLNSQTDTLSVAESAIAATSAHETVVSKETFSPTALAFPVCGPGEAAPVIFDEAKATSMVFNEYQSSGYKIQHIVTLDDNYLRTGRIIIPPDEAKADDDYTQSDKTLEQSLTAQALVSTVLIQRSTAVTMVLSNRSLTFFERLKLRVLQTLCTLERYGPYINGVLIFLAIVVSFYIPITMDNGATGAGGAELSLMLTKFIFVVTLLCLIQQTIILRAVLYRASYTNTISIIVFIASFSLFVAFCLSCDLISTATSGSSTSTATRRLAESAAATDPTAVFMCACAVPTPAPKVVPTQSSTAYSFECTSQQFAAAQGSCDANCGVCGSHYRNSFLAYTVFAAIFSALALFLAFFHALKSITNPVWPLVNQKRFMRITIDGNAFWGYPVYTSLSVGQALRFDKLLSETRAALPTVEMQDVFLQGSKKLSQSVTQSAIADGLKACFEIVENFFFGLLGFPAL